MAIDSRMRAHILWSMIWWRLACNAVVVATGGLLLHGVKPAAPEHMVAYGALGTVLGILATGVFTAYQSLSFEDAPPGTVRFYNTIAAVVIVGMYLFVYLALYSLYRSGIAGSLHGGIEAVMHLAVGLLLSAMHFVDVWDRAQNTFKAEKEDARECAETG